MFSVIVELLTRGMRGKTSLRELRKNYRAEESVKNDCRASYPRYEKVAEEL